MTYYKRSSLINKQGKQKHTPTETTMDTESREFQRGVDSATGQRCPVASALALARTSFENTLLLLTKKWHPEYFSKKASKWTIDPWS